MARRDTAGHRLGRARCGKENGNGDPFGSSFFFGNMKMLKRLSAAFAALFLCASLGHAGTLLPNGEQQFTDNNGLPLSAGCIYFFIPGTNSPKATYQDSSQTIANTNPVLLDAAGRAVIFGTGVYRQVVQQAPCPGGTQIWDQITADTSSSVTIYAGASAGTPNAITVIAPAFSGTDGQVINYVSTNTNTGGATLNPSGFGAVQIVRDSATGPGALTGGELVATNAVSLIYDATAGTFHILSPVTWPNTSGVPVGTVIPVAGFTAPTNYAFAYGQAVSRTTFASLLATLTSAQSGTLASGSPTITGLSDITQLGAGQPVEAVGIPGGTTILSCTGTSCTMSANATLSRTGTITFFAYADGDGSTTFNLPDLRGVTLAGRDNMGGSAAGILTSTYYGASPTTLGKPGGSQSSTLLAANLPPYTPAGSTSVTVTSTPANVVQGAVLGAAAFQSGTNNFMPLQNTTTDSAITSTGTGVFTGTPQGGTSTPVSRVQPAAIINWAVRLTP